VNYGVTFPLFAKVDVNGDAAAPLYRYLKKEKPGLLGSEAIKWNFTKFLVDRKATWSSVMRPTRSPRVSLATSRRLL
jgi:glutathione peroxidase